ncbi:MAG: hypothetical protein B7X31_13530 [Thiomonas sp. 13-66-29]|nr:MAG: hypothetical protein B7X46_03240 [Thiomonas sp. 15-66-11]OZB58463.1 MAG: hypothetical protein B7X31_13530 [Thiomonas sp. 13-66-29]
MVFVAMGVPRQEQFIHKHGDELGATVRPGVGALFDFFPARCCGRHGLCAGWGWNGCFV